MTFVKRVVTFGPGLRSPLNETIGGAAASSNDDYDDDAGKYEDENEDKNDAYECLWTVDGAEAVVSATLAPVAKRGIYSGVTLDNEFLVVNGVVASPFILAHGIVDAYYGAHRALYRCLRWLLLPNDDDDDNNNNNNNDNKRKEPSSSSVRSAVAVATVEAVLSSRLAIWTNQAVSVALALAMESVQPVSSPPSSTSSASSKSMTWTASWLTIPMTVPSGTSTNVMICFMIAACIFL